MKPPPSCYLDNCGWRCTGGSGRLRSAWLLRAHAPGRAAWPTSHGAGGEEGSKVWVRMGGCGEHVQGGGRMPGPAHKRRRGAESVGTV